MKKAVFTVLILLIIAICLPAMADIWYCPKCGRQNNDNFCPADGTARPASLGGNNGSNYTRYAYVQAMLNRRLATRSGPGTQYDEPGSFLGEGYWVTVLSKAYDTSNGIWWVQVEFSDNNGVTYRAYTGVKRLDGLNLSSIPEEKAIGRCRIGSSMKGYYGPSYAYQEIFMPIPAGVNCTIYGYAEGDGSDFIQIEFYDPDLSQYRRAWVPDWSVSDYEMYDGF